MYFSYRNSAYPIVLLCLFLFVQTTLPVGTLGQTSQNAEEVDIQGLLEKLDSNRFADRNSASEKLKQLGIKAIGPLESAAQGDSGEVGTRAVAILANHLKSEQPDLQAAAKQALSRLAEGNNAVATAAANAIEPEKKMDKAEPRFQRPNLPAAKIQIQMQAIAGNAKNIRMKNTNGLKEIEATEDGVKIKITEDPANGIKISVATKDDNGKEETKEYEAKTADELKEKAPEAHKYYEKYNRDLGLKIQMNGQQIGGLNLPFPIRPNAQGRNQPANPKPVMFNPPKVAQKIREVKEDLKELLDDASKIDQTEDSRQLLDRMRQELQASQEKLDEALQNLGPFAR